MKLNYYQFFLSLLSYGVFGRSSDYFNTNYDPKKNCLEEELMRNLTKESFPRCASVVEGKNIVTKVKMKQNFIFKGDDDVQWEHCREKLSQIITLKCRGFGLDRVNFQLQLIQKKLLIFSLEKHFISREEESQSVVIMERNVALLDT